MDVDSVWRHIHAERRALARLLQDLDERDWARESLCAGWSVRDVAAHVISNPQIRVRDLPGLFARNLGHGYNTMIFRDVKERGRQPIARILGDYDRFAESRRHVATTTVIEPLIDALVHHQDIARPLGRRHDMPPEAAAVAADRTRRLAWLMGSHKVVAGTRMVATDIDWVRGDGPVIEGPMSELLMVCAGRGRVAAGLSGDGVRLVTRARGPAGSTAAG